ncbi:MAG: hypothetical protein WCH78_01305 [Bacteroidota bacterium]
MKIKDYSSGIIIAVFLLSSCIKAYEPPVIVTTTPFKVTDVAGIYKQGTLYLEKALLDSVSYKIIDDTSNFSLSYYLKDTIFVSINSNSPVSNKRYKVGLYDSLKNTISTTYKFHKTYTDTLYYLYNLSYNLDVTLYYPETQKKSIAVLTNSSIKARNFYTIYIENVLFSANLQPK